MKSSTKSDKKRSIRLIGGPDHGRKSEENANSNAPDVATVHFIPGSGDREMVLVCRYVRSVDHPDKFHFSPLESVIVPIPLGEGSLQKIAADAEQLGVRIDWGRARKKP
ncbi:hypothetical protein OAE80_01945 [Planctomycetaceae bacterium]|nr:hypothetical protein [Planctomycetaceae bacterium]